MRAASSSITRLSEDLGSSDDHGRVGARTIAPASLAPAAIGAALSPRPEARSRDGGFARQRRLVDVGRDDLELEASGAQQLGPARRGGSQNQAHRKLIVSHSTAQSASRPLQALAMPRRHAISAFHSSSFSPSCSRRSSGASRRPRSGRTSRGSSRSAPALARATTVELSGRDAHGPRRRSPLGRAKSSRARGVILRRLQAFARAGRRRDQSASSATPNRQSAIERDHAHDHARSRSSSPPSGRRPASSSAR